jgi:outer membrane protein assembly factor BamB
MTESTQSNSAEVAVGDRPGTLPGTLALVRSLTFAAAVGGLAVLAFWVRQDPTRAFVENVPGMDGRPAEETRAGTEEPVEIGESFERFAPNPPVAAGNWPRFRGSRFDNICRETTRLADSWDPGGPPVKWGIALGEGHAGPAVHRGRMYVLDYDEAKRADALRCFSMTDGKEIWRRSYIVPVKRHHGMSRTVPAVTDAFIVTIGPKCHCMCVDTESGDLLWGKDLVGEFGAKTPLWYTAQCPLIDGTVAVLAPCGPKVLMMGVDCSTGDILWKTPGDEELQMSHSSITPMTLGGKRQYVYAAVGGIVGISAEESDRGTLLWKTTDFDPRVIAPSPVAIDRERVFMTAGYGGGSIMLRVAEEGGRFVAKTLYRHGPAEGLASEQQSPILYDGVLFGILPKDGGTLRRQLICIHLDNRILWTSGKANRFGLGPFIVADGKLFVLSDDGELSMLRATTKGYHPLASAKILEGPDAWGPMICVGGLLIARDSHRMVCVDLR